MVRVTVEGPDGVHEMEGEFAAVGVLHPGTRAETLCVGDAENGKVAELCLIMVSNVYDAMTREPNE